MEKKALKQGILGSIKLKFYAELIGRFLSSSQNGYQMSEGNENFTSQGNGVYLLTHICTNEVCKACKIKALRTS